MGGITTASFVIGTLNPGSYANSNSVTLPNGTYYVIIKPAFQPGNGSSAIFSNIAYYISTAVNGGGVIYFDVNDTNLKITESNGSGGTYATLYQVGIITLVSSQTLYASVQINYTPGGSNNNGVILSSNVHYYRIA